MSSEALSAWAALAWALAGALALRLRRLLPRRAPTPAPDAGARPDGGEGRRWPTARRCRSRSDVYPLLVPTCKTCHATGEAAGDTELLFSGTAAADYATVVTVRRHLGAGGQPAADEDERQRPPGGSGYAAGSPEYQTILQLDRARSTP